MNILKKLSIVKELFAMVKERKKLILIPIIIALLLISLFIFLVELPALFPFFYAVF